jgi:hypothetical protein
VLLVDGEMSNLQFLEIAQNFTFNPDRDSLQDEKENDADEQPKRKRRRVEIPRDSDSGSFSDIH